MVARSAAVLTAFVVGDSAARAKFAEPRTVTENMFAEVLGSPALAEPPLAESLREWTATWKRGEALGQRIERDLAFSSLLDILPSGGNQRALAGTTGRGRHPLSYARLHEFLSDGAPFHDVDLRPGDRCAIAIPDGPELAVCLLAISLRCTVVPMNPWNPQGEIAADLAETGAKAVIAPLGEDFDHIRRAARGCGAAVIGLARHPEETGLFDLVSEGPCAGGDGPSASGDGRRFNGPNDTALELFTSGTSGRKKRVPIRLRDLCVGAACIAAALELGPEDRGYNMMPLFHVGGIVRNLYAPLLAGSGMIYSDGFDAAMFWDELDNGAGFNWYYASPTMHDSILQEGERRPDSAHQLRFICNAAGDLLPSTADRLRARFDATILPGYGMTECMPIACPPLDYRLERKGASGRILGPDVSILDDAGEAAPLGVAGRIVLRGAPLARIVPDEPGPSAPATPEGWFDTGDIGRFDRDGFLYIVGRGKDVIKRGGETIAPAEIEDVLVGHPDVLAALAFAVPHDMLGETVGCVIVPRSGRRVDLETLAPHLSRHLSPAKWPVLGVYMDDLPKNATGKLLRVRLASRLGIDGVDEKAPARSRLLEAQCPPKGTPIADPIPARGVDFSPSQIEGAIRVACPGATGVVVHVGSACGTIHAAVEGARIEERVLKARLHGAIHDYLVPRSIALLDAFPRHPDTGEIDAEQLRSLMDKPQHPADTPSDEIEAYILDEWRNCLGQDRDVHLDSDFFDDLGGGSLTAVQIIADVRKHYGIALPPTSIFRNRTVRELSTLVRAAVATLSADAGTAGEAAAVEHQGPPAKSQLALPTLITQLLPLAVLPTVFRLGQFACWIFLWWYLSADLGLRGAWVMFAALAAAGAVRNTLGPLAAIALKWMLVGRYRCGAAPLWGHRYLRWWLVRQIHVTAGLGVFSMSYPLTALYYRLMGARVGRRTRIAPSADLGEFDLLAIGDDACIDESAILRPFVLEGTAMDLKPIRLGANVSIGTRATIVPGSVLPADTEIAPLGTSDNSRARNQGTRALSRALLYAPPGWLKGVGTLLKGALLLAAWVPVVLLLHNLLGGLVANGGYLAGPADLLVRMLNPQRLIGSAAVLLVSTVATPFLYLAGVILVKWTVIGRFHAEDDITRPWPMFERWLMWQLLPDGRFGGVAPLLGSNFAAISVIHRLLGAKVGKRIYWPGSGNVMTEYDLFECGDDVTFGSRSTYLMTSAHGSRPIRIEPGANVADRCVLAPGVVVSRNAVLGSGTFAPEGFVAPAGSTWIGQDGRETPIELEAATPRRVQAETLRPYGRAMYMGEATYAVWPLAAHIIFDIAWAALGALYRTAPMIAALLLTRAVLIAEGPGLRNPAGILLLLAGFYLPLHLTSAFGALGVLVATKWLIIGHRVEGEQFWTQSSYCQRWKIHSVISSLSSGWFGNRNLLAFLEGSAFLVWYFRAQGAQIGANVCLYPNGADPMTEEPDLLHIGDEARIDQAVLIAHLNTRGEWMMGPIQIAAGACLRTASRVMMMSTVGQRSTLLEGTLVLAGDSSTPSSTWYGWPGEAITPTAMAHRRAPAIEASRPADAQSATAGRGHGPDESANRTEPTADAEPAPAGQGARPQKLPEVRRSQDGPQRPPTAEPPAVAARSRRPRRSRRTRRRTALTVLAAAAGMAAILTVVLVVRPTTQPVAGRPTEAPASAPAPSSAASAQPSASESTDSAAPSSTEAVSNPPVPSPPAPSVAIPTVEGPPISVGATPGFVTISPDGHLAYIARRAAGVATVLDTSINKVVADVPIPEGPPQFIAFAPDGSRAYVSVYNADLTTNAVAVLDTRTTKLLEAIPVDKKPYALAVSPDQKFVYVPSHDAAAVDIIDIATNTVVQTVPVPPNPHWVTFAPDGKVAYITDHESNVLSVLDTASNTVVQTINVGTSPHSVAVSPDGKQVAVVCFDSNNLYFIDAATNQVQGSVPVGTNPQDVTYAPDGRYLYTANVESGTVSVVDTQTRTVTANIPTDSPTSIAVLPNGSKAYVTNLNAGTLTVLNTAG